MRPLDLSLGQPGFGVLLPGDSGQPPRVTRVVGGYQLHPSASTSVRVIPQHLLIKFNRSPAMVQTRS